jgi:hypothetical protein
MLRDLEVMLLDREGVLRDREDIDPDREAVVRALVEDMLLVDFCVPLLFFFAAVFCLVVAILVTS